MVYEGDGGPDCAGLKFWPSGVGGLSVRLGSFMLVEIRARRKSGAGWPVFNSAKAFPVMMPGRPPRSDRVSMVYLLLMFPYPPIVTWFAKDAR